MTTEVILMNSTIQGSRSGHRRVVRRAKLTLDQAWATALSDLPPELHPLVRRHVEAMQAANKARGDLTQAMSHYGVRWRDVDRVTIRLAAAA
jgi:hypothetical protein